MQIRRIRLVNFRQHADTQFDLGTGLTAIIGPNGAGKTTLLEAIAWVLYGNAAARGTRDSIRWNRAPARSPVRVELEFSLGAHEYQVVRTQREAQLFQDRGTSAISAGTEEVSRVVTRTLGMTRDEFFNTYFTGQKELAVMATMGPADRGRFLSRVLGYEKLRIAQDAMRIEKNRAKSELIGLEHGLGDAAELERERVNAAAHRDETARAVDRATAAKEAAAKVLAVEGPQWTRMADLRQKALAMDGDRRAAEQQVTDAKREHERLDKELAGALDAKTAFDKMKPALAEVEPLQKELETLEAEARGADQHRGLTGQLREVESQLMKLAARLKDTPDPAAALAAGERELANARRALAEAQAHEDKVKADWESDKATAKAKRVQLLEQYKETEELRDKVKQLGPEGLCPTCGRPLGKDFEQMLKTLSHQLEAIKDNGEFYRDRIAQLETEPAEVTERATERVGAAALVDQLTQVVAEARSAVREWADLQREMVAGQARVKDIERKIIELPEKYDVERHDVVRDRLKELEPKILQQAGLAVKADRAAALVSEMEAAEKRLSEREAAVTQLTAALAALGFSDERHTAARQRYEEAKAADDSARERVLELRGDLKMAEAQLASVSQRVKDRAARAARAEGLRSEFRLHEQEDLAFGELSTDLNMQLGPELSATASSLLAELTDGRYSQLELNDKYQVEIVEEGSLKPVISGGEEDVVNLVLRLAISQLVAERAGQPLSLLVLDEIFGSLDEGRREHVVSLLRGLADRFPQVVLITHIESVRDRVDRVLRVTLDQVKGAAVVTEDTPELLVGV